MNNINALLFSTSVIGISTQQEQLNVQSVINFRDLINNLLKKENDIEISNLVQNINSNPEILKSVYEVVATLHLYSQLNEIATLNTNELENNQIISFVLNNNNLNQEEKQIALNSIKIISQHVIKNNSIIPVSVNSENYENINQQLNLFTTKQNLSSNSIVTNSNSNSNNITVNLKTLENNDTANQITTNNSSLSHNTRAIQVLPAPDNSAKIINNGFVSLPVEFKNNEKSVASINNSQELNIIGNNLKINISESNIKIENLIKIKNQVSDIINLLSNIPIDKNNKELQNEINNLKNYNKEIDNIINRIIASNINEVDNLKNISYEISKIINSIFISLINATANLYNHKIYNNEDDQQDAVNPIGKFIKDNNFINSEPAQNNRHLYITQNENSDLLKELISKIFLMLKEMNSELYIAKKIEYVYKPFSSQSSQVTPDGVLLINTANIKNFEELFNLNLQQIIYNKSTAEINNQSNTLNKTAENIAITNTLNNFNTIKNISSNPVSITHNYDIPKTFNLAKDNTTQNIINTINRNYNSNLKNVVDEVNTYFVNFIENKSEQKPVDAKIFDKVIDFSGRVRDDVVIKQIVKNITDAVKFKISEKIEVKMMLRPENLGPVIVKFEAKDNVINGRIDVATTVTRDILKANIIELKNTLNNLGYNIENFEVSMLNAYTSDNSNNMHYFNRQDQQIPVYINNKIIEDIGVITGTDSYLNYLA